MADRSSGSIDRYHHHFLALARMMFSTRLHLLRLTEVVRLGVRPTEDGVMELPAKLDREMQQQAFDFVLEMMPEEFRVELVQARDSWVTVQ